MDLGSCPSEVVERAIQSKELRRSIGRLNPKDLVLKVAGKEEYMLEEKSISSYQVRQRRKSCLFVCLFEWLLTILYPLK